MFALLAILAFVVAMFEASIGEIDLLLLGLAFLGVHLLFPWTPWRR